LELADPPFFDSGDHDLSPSIRVEKRNISRHPSGELVGAPVYRPHLLRLAFDKFMTGGKQAIVLQLSFSGATGIFAARRRGRKNGADRNKKK